MKFYVELGVSIVETVKDGQYVGNCTSSISQSGMVAIEINDNRFPLLHFSEVFQADGTTPIGINLETAQDYLIANTVFNTASGGSEAVWGSITGILSDQTDLEAELNGKQDELVSGTNIKTINGDSVLGSGDLVISSGGGGGGIHVLKTPFFGQGICLNITQAINSLQQALGTSLNLFPFLPAKNISINNITIEVSNALPGSYGSFTIYDDLNGKPNNRIYQSAGIDTSTTGYKSIILNQSFVAGETYYFGLIASQNISYRATPAGNTYAMAYFNSTGTQYTTNYFAYLVSMSPGAEPTTLSPASLSLSFNSIPNINLRAV